MIEETLTGIQVPTVMTVQESGSVAPTTIEAIVPASMSNGTPAVDLYAQVNTLLGQATTVKSNPLVSDADIVAMKAKLTTWANSIKGNNMIVSSGDYSLITDGLKSAQASVAKYSNDVSDANKNILLFGGILVAVVVLVVVIKK